MRLYYLEFFLCDHRLAIAAFRGPEGDFQLAIQAFGGFIVVPQNNDYLAKWKLRRLDNLN